MTAPAPSGDRTADLRALAAVSRELDRARQEARDWSAARDELVLALHTAGTRHIDIAEVAEITRGRGRGREARFAPSGAAL